MPNRRTLPIKPRTASPSAQRQAKRVLQQLVSMNGGNQSELARALHMSPNAINHIVHGKKSIGHKTLEGVARISPDAALAMLGNATLWDTLQLPAVRQIVDILKTDPVQGHRAEWAVRAALTFDAELANRPEDLIRAARTLLAILGAQIGLLGFPSWRAPGRH